MRHSKLWLLPLGMVILALGASVLAQSAYPIRFDQEPEPAAPLSSDVVVLGGIHLEPQSAPAVDCSSAEHVGYMYVQLDVGANPNSTWESQVCVCLETDSGGFGWWNPQTSCDDLRN